MTSQGANNGQAAELAGRSEAERRAGRPERAREIASAAVAADGSHAPGHVALALALVDCGDLLSAHAALERAFDALGGVVGEPAAAAGELGGFGSLGDSELESAFETAEAQPDEMADANHVAAAALRLVEEGEPEGVNVASAESPFATETVAGLLERQGHASRAREVRSVARERGRRREAGLDDAERARVVATLSRWLQNLRRRTA